jgi:ACS family hexuronate transporter-like MFS transporter
MKTVAEWFRAKERGMAGGLYNIGASPGSMLAPPLIAWATLMQGREYRPQLFDDDGSD